MDYRIELLFIFLFVFKGLRSIRRRLAMLTIFVLALSSEVTLSFICTFSGLFVAPIHGETLSSGGGVFNHSIGNKLCHYDEFDLIMVF